MKIKIRLNLENIKKKIDYLIKKKYNKVHELDEELVEKCKDLVSIVKDD